MLDVRRAHWRTEEEHPDKVLERREGRHGKPKKPRIRFNDQDGQKSSHESNKTGTTRTTLTKNEDPGTPPKWAVAAAAAPTPAPREPPTKPSPAPVKGSSVASDRQRQTPARLSRLDANKRLP